MQAEARMGGKSSTGAAAMFEHRGNGEHPHLQQRRRQLLLWRSLAMLTVLVEVLGLARLLRGVLVGSSPQSVAYQAVWLTLNGLLGVLVFARVRFLQRR
jgi:hypothetical protein